MRSITLVATLLFSTLTFAQGESYTISETPIGTLVDDPAAAAVLETYMPGSTTSPQLNMVRGITLLEVQAANPAALSDETLAEIQADLSALPAN